MARRYRRFLRSFALAPVLLALVVTLTPRRASAINFYYPPEYYAWRSALNAFSDAYLRVAGPLIAAGATAEEIAAACQADSALVSAYNATRSAGQALRRVAPWLVRGAFVTLPVLLGMVLFAEVCIAGYLIYQLMDAIGTYAQALELSNKLDQEIRAVQDGINNLQGGQGCCCNNTVTGTWENAFYGEFTCRGLGTGTDHVPGKCYDGKPTPDEVAQAGSISAACEAKPPAQQPQPTDVPEDLLLFWCDGGEVDAMPIPLAAQTLENANIDEETYCALRGEGIPLVGWRLMQPE